MADILHTTFSNSFLKEIVRILIRLLLKLILKGMIYDKSALVKVMAWHQWGDRSSHKLRMTWITDTYVSPGSEPTKVKCQDTFTQNIIIFVKIWLQLTYCNPLSSVVANGITLKCNYIYLFTLAILIAEIDQYSLYLQWHIKNYNELNL